MKKKRMVPVFATEAQESDCWYKNRKKLDRDLVEAARAGELKILNRKALISPALKLPA